MDSKLTVFGFFFFFEVGWHFCCVKYWWELHSLLAGTPENFLSKRIPFRKKLLPPNLIYVCSLSHVQLFMTPWTVARQAPPGSSVHGIFQARILEWVAIFLLQGNYPTQGSNPHVLHWQVDSLPLRLLRSPRSYIPFILTKSLNCVVFCWAQSPRHVCLAYKLFEITWISIQTEKSGTSLVIQWLRLRAPNTGGAWVPSLVRELDHTCRY